MFIHILDSIFERIGFSKYNNKLGDLVDDTELFIYGSQDSAEMSSSIRLVGITKLYRSCGVYMINSNTKYSTKRDYIQINFRGTIHIMDGIR